MPFKIAITGRFRRGKDTLGDFIEHRLAGQSARLHFAYALKAELAEMTYHYIELLQRRAGDTQPHLPHTFKLWLDKMMRERELNGLGWQWYGEFRRQTAGEDYWVQHPLFQYEYRRAVDQGEHIIITDMRHHVEHKWCRDNGFYLIRINGPCHTTEARDPDHPSERYIDELEVDHEVDNSGTLGALRLRALGIVDYLSTATTFPK